MINICIWAVIIPKWFIATNGTTTARPLNTLSISNEILNVLYFEVTKRCNEKYSHNPLSYSATYYVFALWWKSLYNNIMSHSSSPINRVLIRSDVSGTHENVDVSLSFIYDILIDFSFFYDFFSLDLWFNR